MPSVKLLEAVKDITENHRSVSQAMRNAGYAESTATKPSNLTNTKAFKELMNERGLTDELLTDSLKEDILLKPQNRLGELALMAKLKGHLKEQENPNVNNVIVLPNSLISRISETLPNVENNEQHTLSNVSSYVDAKGSQSV